MSIDPRTPCLIGVGQRTWRPGGDELSPEPLHMQAEAVRLAVADTGARGDVLAAVDSLSTVYCMSWDYDDPMARLATEVGASPSHSSMSTMSGTSHQALQIAAARRILAGETDVAVVAGAEALDTVRRLRHAGETPQWSHPAPVKPAMPFDFPFLDIEVAHTVLQAYLTFALRGVARRAHLGMDVETHRRLVGDLLAPMTEVAARNPHAWFPRVKTADELSITTAENRMVSYPYTKFMMAIMDVDMAAATIVASHEAADRLGVPLDRRVYLRSWAEANDANYVAEHPDMWRSPAMHWCAGQVLAAAGVSADDVAHFDLYSCFASSIKFALDALGIDQYQLGGRSVTVTGGLPFCGGPASNYMGHSSASMVDVLRNDPASMGLVTGVGMHMTKHSWALWSTEPGSVAPPPPAPEPARRTVVEHHTGPARLLAYTVIHARTGEPEWGVGVAEPEGGPGTGCYVRFEDPDMLASMEEEEWVDRDIDVATDSAGLNQVR